jgi:hypothetical protein
MPSFIAVLHFGLPSELQHYVVSPHCPGIADKGLHLSPSTLDGCFPVLKHTRNWRKLIKLVYTDTYGLI